MFKLQVIKITQGINHVCSRPLKDAKIIEKHFSLNQSLQCETEKGYVSRLNGVQFTNFNFIIAKAYFFNKNNVDLQRYYKFVNQVFIFPKQS